MVKAIDVCNLTKKFGSFKAIDNLTFSVEQGEVLGFLGPNGAGKSTTMHILAGLTQATSGTASIFDTSLALYPDKIKNLIGYMPENNPLPEDMRVIEYLKYRAELKNISRKKQSSRIDEVLEVCELSQKTRNKIIRNLSKGFKQRLGVADAILSKPKLVIMDEPTIGLDPHQVINFRNLLKDLKSEITFMLSSHILSEIETSCNRVVIVNHGRIVAAGSYGDLQKEFMPEKDLCISLYGNIESLLDKINSLNIKFNIHSHKTENPLHHITIKTVTPDKLTEELLYFCRFNDALKINEIFVQKPTLEDIFLAATQRSWKQSSSINSI